MSDATSGALTDDERADCAVCAALLYASGVWQWLALVAVPLGAAAAALPAPRPAGLVALAALALAERWLAGRVALDARLFDRLAAGALSLDGLDGLDGALRRVLAVPAAKARRPLAPRIAGAKRLAALHLAAVGLLVAFDLAAALWRWR